MRTIFYLRAAALVVAVAAMSGCGKEFSPADEPGEALRTVTLCLSTAPLEDAAEEATRGGEMPLRVEAEGIEGVDVRLVPSDTEATRSVSNVDEYKISDVWVIQLNSAGTAKLTAPQYISAVTDNAVKLQLDTDTSCRLYVIANTHNATLFSGVTTASQVESATLSLTAESSLASGGTLPMCGYATGTVGEELGVALTRMVAKLMVQVSAPKITLQSMKVRKVPKVLHWFRNPSSLDPGTTAANCYPATSSQFFDEYASTTGYSGWWYVPANARGTGTATTQQTKTAATALGGASGQGNYATYVELTGYTPFQASTATAAALNRYFTLKIYPGANNTNGYSLLPNRYYTLLVDVPTAPSASDGRVTTEDRVVDGWTGVYSSSGIFQGAYKVIKTSFSWSASLVSTHKSTCENTFEGVLPTRTDWKNWLSTVSWTNNVVLCESDTYFYGQNGTSSYYANPSGTVTIVCVRY